MAASRSDPPNPSSHPAKRQRHSPAAATADDGDDVQDLSPTREKPPAAEPHAASSAARPSVGNTSNFRNVSACNRCRLRKNRCDQKLPSCSSCAKAGVACVGYDPITKKQIPRSYVFYLETRVEQLEGILLKNDISFPPADDLELCSRTGSGPRSGVSATETGVSETSDIGRQPEVVAGARETGAQTGRRPPMLDAVGPTKPRSLASASGVSFARVVRAAVQYSVSDQATNPDRPAGRRPPPATAGTSMRDSFFGLHTKPTIRPAPFPDEELGRRLVNLYFEFANPQIPILHRVEFMDVFERIYSTKAADRLPRELYLLNIVLAIGSGVIIDDGTRSEVQDGGGQATGGGKATSVQAEPEEYHASAIVHLESCLSSSGGGLEVLQAVLLLANFALLRPVPPGLWYIVGVAVRLAVDLGLHCEDGNDGLLDRAPGIKSEPGEGPGLADLQPNDRGRRIYARDKRRRLWWCTYALDRLVSVSVGRPFGISDQVITAELPSIFDDKYITRAGIFTPDTDEPSYKHVSSHYLRLRFLQSEILQVLMYKQTQLARASDQDVNIPEMNSRLPSPFLVDFDSFRSWRIDIDRRLYEWKMAAPSKEKTGVAFSTEFLMLNYWQAIILLYRNSLSVPHMFEDEYNTSKEVNSPMAYAAELDEDEDRIYLKVAEAGQKILRLYRQLHLSGLVSYTYLSTHHLFMAGIAYLYAIWHSPIVRSRLSMDEVDFTILAAKSVFTDLIDKCPPAEACRDAFDRTARATIKMANVNGGFGSSTRRKRKLNGPPLDGPVMDWPSTSGSPSTGSGAPYQPSRTPGFDAEGLSSRAVSADKDAPLTPHLSSISPYEEGYGVTLPRGQALESPSDGGSTGQGVSPIDPALLATPALGGLPGTSQQQQQQQQAGSYLGRQSAFRPTVEYPDLQSMEFLQAPQGGAQPSADLGSLDPLGFGLGWDAGLNQEVEGQQVDLFDRFFFGGQGQGQQEGGEA